MKRGRLRDLGITIGRLRPGPNNAITDVAGVRVGYSTLCLDKPHVLRTGVTVLWPQADIFRSAVFAGSSCFNGYGEMTGSLWLAEQGLLTSPIALTSTCCVGVVRDALCAYAVKSDVRDPTLLPVVAETDDTWLSESETFPITRDLVFAALENATAVACRRQCWGWDRGHLPRVQRRYRNRIEGSAAGQGQLDARSARPGELWIAVAADDCGDSSRPGAQGYPFAL